MSLYLGRNKITPTIRYGSGGNTSATLISKTINNNGTYNAVDDNADGYSSVTVDIQFTKQNKIVDPSITSQTITADMGYDALNAVTINPVTSNIDSNIVSSNIRNGVTILGVTGTLSVGASGDCTPGQSKDEPITVSRAYSIASTLASGEVSPNKYYVFGKVTGIISHGPNFTTFDITDGTNTLNCYQMKMKDGTAPINTYTDFEAGSYITIYTEFKNDNDSLQCNLPVLVTFENNILNSILEGSTKTIDFNNMPGCTSIKSYLFQDNSNLTSVNISNKIRTIQHSAFSNCTNLQSVTFAEGSVLDTINTGAFFGCSSLSSIRLPESLAYAGNSIFVNCTSLESLYIPGSLTILGNSFASQCTALTNLTISEGVLVIGEQAFSSCSALETLTLPSTITEIEANAFSYCNNLTTINYAGTCDEWRAISKGNSWNYSSIETVICSDGTINANE